jgi:hypothetical protein
MKQHHAPPGRALLLAAVAASLLACAAPQPPAPATPATPGPQGQPAVRLRRTEPPADLGIAERYAWQAVIQLGEDYGAGDVEGFMARVSRGFYRGYPALESALRAHLEGTTSRSVVVAVDGVAAEGERVSVSARWERSLARRDGAAQLLSGTTVFLFLRSETSLRLLDFRGDPPFGIEGILELP